MNRRTAVLAVLTALSLVVSVLQMQEMWELSAHTRGGADFGSYFWAWKSAIAGIDPYDTNAISRVARDSGQARGVHPFFYPPPFLLAMAWVGERTVHQAYRLWFWVDVACAAACAATLIAWWGNGRPDLRWLVLIAFLSMSAVVNNHVMGQVNLPVLSVVLLALWATDRDRYMLGGVLMGIACMAKMSPAFFVAWWLLRGRYRAVAACCGAAVALSVVAQVVVPLDVQVRFYTEVLPGFGTGDYNGLRVPIALFGNHSLPEIFNTLWPGTGGVLSPVAKRVSTGFLLVVVGGLAVAFRGRGRDEVSRMGQIGAVALAVLLVPVYTYEHHLVYAIPAAVAVTSASLTGRLPRWTLVVWAVAWLVLAVDLPVLRLLSAGASGVLSVGFREVKLASLLAFFLGAVVLGRGGETQRR